MTDFALLNLVKCTAPLNPNGSGDDETWEMTEYGKETFAIFRLRQMSQAKKPRSEEPGKSISTKS